MAPAHLEIAERFVHTAIDRRRAAGNVSHVRQDHEAHECAFAVLQANPLR